MLGVLTMMFHGDYRFRSCLVGVLCASCICMGVFFLSFRKFFFYDLIKELLYDIHLGFFLLFYAYTLKD